MSAATYDETFHAQAHYRGLLDAMARPGKINVLPAVPLHLPGKLSFGSAYIAHTLLDGNVSFGLIGFERDAGTYLSGETGAREVEPEKADFLFAPGDMATLALRVAKLGTLLDPESSATLICSLDGLWQEPRGDGLKLRLRGPGIESETVIFVKGVARELFEDRVKRNAEYPLGVDIVFTYDSDGTDSHIVCLPRTTSVVCEA